MPLEQSANPDEETYSALKPGLMRVPGSILIGISTPYRKAGLLHRKFRECYGRDESDVLVVRAPSIVMNPTLDQAVIAAEIAADPAKNSAEYLATFRDDVSGWATRELIEAAVDRGVVVRPPRPGVSYRCFIDHSGGIRDSACAALSHLEDGAVVLDCLVEVPAPFDPSNATQRMADAIKAYGVRTAVGDKYAAAWVVEAFARCGVKYEHSERDRSAIYLDALPMFTFGRARLLDNRKLVMQFASLERRTSPIGKERVDHGPGGHDDLCNAAAGAMALASAPSKAEAWVRFGRATRPLLASLNYAQMRGLL